MKRKILLSIICVCSLFETQAQEWGYDQAFEGEYMTKIWVQGLDTVYVVGSKLIAKSTDRGHTWNKQYLNYYDYYGFLRPAIPDIELTDIVFCDQNNGFIVGADIILKTTDGGDSWEKEESGTGLLFNAIACTSLNDIWVVGYNGTVLHSIDSGKTWSSVIIDANQNIYNFNGIVFKDDIGYITGGGEQAALYKTEDKGQTWNKQLTDSSYGSCFYPPYLTDNNAYMGFRSYSYPYPYSLFQTQDYQNWKETSLDIPFESLFFLNDTIGYSFYAIKTGRPEHVYIDLFKTENGGDNWIPVEINYGPKGYMNTFKVSHYSNNCIQFANDTIGYAINGGIFCKTPLPDYSSWVHLEEFKKPEPLIVLYNANLNLLIKAQGSPIVSVQIIDISGKVIEAMKCDTAEYEKIINTSTMPKGLYIIKSILSDNTICVNKWIKY